MNGSDAQDEQGSGGAAGSRSPADPVAVLRRWEDAGGVWRTAAVGPHTATVVLLRCDGGEEVDRFTSDDPHLLAWLANTPPERDNTTA